MRSYVWTVLIAVALALVIVWQRASISRMDEQYRVLRERQDRLDTMAQEFPAMMRVALERHHNRLVAYWETRDD